MDPLGSKMSGSNGEDQERPSKRSRRANDDDTRLSLLLLKTLWSHWQAYLDGTPDDEDEELIELLDVAAASGVLSTPHPSTTPTNNTAILEDTTLLLLAKETTTTPVSLMMPILLSVASLLLVVRDSNNNNIQQALYWWPDHPAAWLALLQQQQRSTCARAYASVAQRAQTLRNLCIQWLEDHEEEEEEEEGGDGDTGPTAAEIIEGLVLYHGLGVEMLLGEPRSSEDDDDEEENGRAGKTAGEEDAPLEWSFSAVEATARTIAATLYSQEGNHAAAAQELRRLDCSYRIHPNVWDATCTETTPSSSPPSESKSSPGKIVTSGEPVVFLSPVLPEVAYKKLLNVFGPEAEFWKETDYEQRGYYSFFVDRLQPKEEPYDFVQDVIESCLLPLVDERTTASSPIVGYEWWVHTRPVASQLGHNLHFDTDEALLNNQKQQEISHPIISSVLYLDAPSSSGATIVLNQSSEEGATMADCVWRNDPKPNSYLIFPGNLLHGVLPCGNTTQQLEKQRSSDYNEWSLRVEDYLLKKPLQQSETAEHRTSFMIGYWTRSALSTSKSNGEDPYGPCRPIPRDSQWMILLREGYPRPALGTSSTSIAAQAVVPKAVPCLSPAWEALEEIGDDDDDDVVLEIPSAVDHLYFVHEPGTSFRERLLHQI